MAWVGWFKFGNTNIVNNELSRGMAESASPAPFNWFTGPRLPTVQQALDPNLPYNQASIQQTPWYDPTIPESERFFGVYGLGVSGLVGSTRNVAVVESIEDGGVLGIPRKATKPLVYSVLLTARGRDALEYGFEWLDAVLDADACGMHGDICGVSDLQFYSDVPPARGTVDYYSDWLTTATNLLTNPSMETAGSSVVVWTNLVTNPSMEGSSAAVGVRTNMCTNPRMLTLTGWANGSTGSVTQTATASGQQYDVTGTIGATNLVCYQSTAITVAPGDVIGTSVQVTVPAGFPAVSLYLDAQEYNPGTGIYARGATITIQPGQTATVPSGILTVDSTGNGFRSVLRFAASTPVGARLIVANCLVEKASYIGQYFDGTSTLDAGLYGAWTGAVDGSASTLMAVQVTSWTAQSSFRYQASAKKRSRSHSMGCVLSPVVGAGAYTTFAQVVGSTYTLSAWVYSASAVTMRAAYTNGTVTSGGTATAVPANTWTQLSVTGTATSTTGYLSVLTTVAPSAGTLIYIDDAMATNTPTPTVNFDGSASPDPDLTAAWTGTPDASTSTLSGVMPAEMTSGTFASNVSSSQWAASGTKSLRVIPISASTNTFSAIGGYQGAFKYGMVAGGTYTVMATARLTAPQTGALGAIARSIAVWTNGTAGWTNIATSAAAPNAAGQTILRVTFTIPANATGVWIGLYNGASAGNGDVWWDDVVVVEGTYAGEYFDGSNLPAGSDINLTRVFWDGTADASTSELQTREALTRPQTDDEWAATVNLMARYMHGVGTIAGPMVAQELESGPFNAYIVTFTLQATRPYIYSASTDLDLPPQIPIVYQDIPYNLAQYPSFELTDGTTPVVATNYVLNPSVETDATGWAGSAATISGTSPAAFFTSGRVTGELSSVGNSSFRDRILGDGSTVVTNSKAQLSVSQTVDLSAIASSAGKRPSVTVWAAATILAGASGSSIDGLSAYLQWLDSSGTSLRTDTLGTASAGTYNGHVFSQQSMVPPAGWSKAVVLVNCNVTWSSSSTPANNSDIRLYVDAMGVTIP